MLREMEMGVVVWDFFRAGGTPPLGEEVWEDFLEGLLSAGNRFSSYFCYIGLLHYPTLFEDLVHWNISGL